MPQFNTQNGIESVLVFFDQPSSVYYAGSVMTGTIVVKVDETSPVRGIKIRISGKMDLFWRKAEGGATIEYAEVEDYLDDSVNIWIPNPRKKDEQWIFPGIHKYNFTYNLPSDIPESLEESRYGTVRYTVKASVFLTLGRVSNSLEEAFYIRALPDPRAPVPLEAELPKENTTYSTIRGTCFSGKTEVELYLRVEKNIYRLGDRIPVHVECTIKGSAAVEKVIVLLVQETIYICNYGSKDEERKKELLVMSEAIDEEDTDAGECQEYNLMLEVDKNLPLSNFPWCEFIEMGYFIHAVARTNSFYDDIVVKLPLIITPEDPESAIEIPPDDLVAVDIEGDVVVRGEDGENDGDVENEGEGESEDKVDPEDEEKEEEGEEKENDEI